MDDKNCKDKLTKKQKNWGTDGGLYRGAKVPVKTLNRAIITLLVLLVGVVMYLASTSHYTITFEVNGGETIPSYPCKYGDYIQIDTPIKTGYTFAGWYQDQDLKKPWDLHTDTIKDSMTLYASWTPSKIIVMFDLNGGHINTQHSIDPIERNFNTTYAPLPTPQIDNKTFVGWQYNGLIIKDDTKVTMNGEHTLKAIWE